MKTQPFSQFGHVIELCCEYLSVQCIWLCYYHVTCAFQSISTLYSCINVKEFLAWNRRNIWSLSDYNGTLIQNLLVRKRTLNHLAKLAEWLSCVVSTYLYGAFDCMLFSCHLRVSEWIHTLQPEFLRKCHSTPCSKQAPHLKFDSSGIRTHNHLIR